MKKENKIIKKFKGVVLSDKMDKTIVVQVKSTKLHPIYKKRFTVSSNYKVHDPKNKFKAADKVVFRECRPLSKSKRWIVLYD